MSDPGYLTDHIDLNGRKIAFTEILHLDLSPDNQSEFKIDVISFFQQWLSGQVNFQVKTSGSTGAPKNIFLTRQQMETSAKTTLGLLNLKPGDSALLCLPARYIAGKMMIVRSLVGNLN